VADADDRESVKLEIVEPVSFLIHHNGLAGVFFEGLGIEDDIMLVGPLLLVNCLSQHGRGGVQDGGVKD
jgi:hypothetical protein